MERLLPRRRTRPWWTPSGHTPPWSDEGMNPPATFFGFFMATVLNLPDRPLGRKRALAPLARKTND